MKISLLNIFFLFKSFIVLCFVCIISPSRPISWNVHFVAPDHGFDPWVVSKIFSQERRQVFGTSWLLIISTKPYIRFDNYTCYKTIFDIPTCNRASFCSMSSLNTRLSKFSIYLYVFDKVTKTLNRQIAFGGTAP